MTSFSEHAKKTNLNREKTASNSQSFVIVLNASLINNNHRPFLRLGTRRKESECKVGMGSMTDRCGVDMGSTDHV